MKKSKVFIFLLVLAISLTSVTFADTVKYGSKGAEVIKLQTQLKKLGLFSGKATGYFGSKTKAAVKKFQAQKGISTTGTVGPKTTKALLSIGTSSKSSTSKIEKAASKETLKKAQTALKQMGFYKGKIDGLYGKLTSAALKEFQKKNDIKLSGVFDKETESKLKNYQATKVASRSGSALANQASRTETVKADSGEIQMLIADTASAVTTSTEAGAAAETEVLLETKADNKADNEGEE